MIRSSLIRSAWFNEVSALERAAGRDLVWLSTLVRVISGSPSRGAFDRRGSMSTKMRPLRLSANRRWVASFVLCSVCLVLGGSQIGAQSDCDGNGVDDALDLVRDPEADCDGDGVLDVCQLEPEA